jgi:hypothetical protein
VNIIERGMYLVSTVEDIYKDPQLESRRFWACVQDAASGKTLKYPGGFAMICRERLKIKSVSTITKSMKTSAGANEVIRSNLSQERRVYGRTDD